MISNFFVLVLGNVLLIIMLNKEFNKINLFLLISETKVICKVGITDFYEKFLST